MQRSVVAVCVLSLLLATPLQLWAASEGPNFAGTAINDPDTTINWLNPGNATTSNDSRATATIADLGDPDLDTTDHLQATNFGFSLPAGATPLGMECEIEVQAGTSAANDISDAFVNAVVGGVTQPGNDRSNSFIWTASDVFNNHGSTSDLWGRTWTIAEINATGFGCAVKATVIGDGAGSEARVDSFRITWTFVAATKLLITKQTRVGQRVEWLE